jgi:hypothetical protein
MVDILIAFSSWALIALNFYSTFRLAASYFSFSLECCSLALVSAANYSSFPAIPALILSISFITIKSMLLLPLVRV